MQSLAHMLNGTTCAKLVATKTTPVITIEALSSVGDALTVLANYKILSAPVKEANKMIGFVDVLDIVAFALDAHGTAPTIARPNDWYHALLSLSQHGFGKLQQTPVKEIMNLSGNNPALGVNGRATVYELTKYFLANGIHRVPILDDNQTILGVLSQSDILQFLVADLSKFEKFSRLTVGDLQLAKNVIRVTMDTQIVQAFELMKTHKVSAVAVVDNVIHNTLMANLSASDIRGLQLSQFSALMLPIFQYFSLNLGMFKPPMTCKLSSSFETLVLKLALFRMHRVWLVDDSDAPVGVVSLTDIMKVVAKAVEDDIEQGAAMAPSAK